MNFKPLGSAAKVSEIGMGTYYDPQWIATAKSIGWTRGAASKVEALKAGLDGGINFIDTAELYGSEHARRKGHQGQEEGGPFHRDEGLAEPPEEGRARPRPREEPEEAGDPLRGPLSGALPER